MRHLEIIPWLSALALATACGSDRTPPDAGARPDVGFFEPVDAGRGDARPVDAAPGQDAAPQSDAGASDASGADASSADASGADATESDAGTTDAGGGDASPGDSTPGDGSIEDGGATADSALPDTGPGDTGLGGDAGVFTQGGGLVITEILARTAGLEWIEVHNTSNTAILLTSYSVSIFSHAAQGNLPIRAGSDPTGAGSIAVSLAPGAYAVGVPNPANAASIPGNASFVFGAPGALGANAFGDSGDVVTIGDASAGDRLDYRAAATDPGVAIGAAEYPVAPDAPMQLSPPVDGAGGELGNDNGGVWCALVFGGGTPGAVNRSCAAFVISEVLPNYDSFTTGADDGQEFIEIAGPAGGTLASLVLVRVEGTTAPAGTTETPEIAITGTRMPLDGLYVVADNIPNMPTVTSVANADQVTDLVMENGPDAVQLVRVGGTPVLLDAFAYGAVTASLDRTRNLAMVEGTPTTNLSASSNYSVNFARADSEADTDNNAADFHYDPSPTPGARNGQVNFALTALSPNNLLAASTGTVTFTGTDFAGQMQLPAFVQTPAPTVSCPSSLTTTANTLVCRVTWPSGQAAAPLRVDVTLRTRAEINLSSTLAGAFTWTTANNETNVAAECDFCNLQFPTTLTAGPGQGTQVAYGRIYEAGRTDTTVGGPAPNILAELGYGRPGTDPRTVNWTWTRATFNVETGNDDEYQARILAPGVGTYSFTYRFSLDGGLSWSYADMDGAGSNAGLDFSTAQLGTLTVN
ncbi:MAG: hypothetical protein IT384_10800 [Deltaproteobacteria bacterium]|nr:hypothetical protein [Deltaproteobacteria bacterium]